MDKKVVKKYTVVGEDDYDTKIYYLWSMYADLYDSIMRANTEPVKKALEYDDADADNDIDVRIYIGQYPDFNSDYIVFTGEEYTEVKYISFRLEYIKRTIRGVFYG